jgi:3-deoxy-7-phosphoheptulonate synthase
MHGNTVTVGGVKTRDFNMIVAELRAAFEAHRAEGSQLHGVHFELTGENITECIGGAEGLTAADLGRMYETGCDPRLNYAQSLEIAFVIARMLRTEGRRAEPPWDEW